MAPGEEMSWEAATSAWEGFMVNYRIKEERFPRMRIIDTFLLFTVVRAPVYRQSPGAILSLTGNWPSQATGLVQLLYCLLFGSYPFNAFLGGFLSCVGTFTLTGPGHIAPCF